MLQTLTGGKAHNALFPVHRILLYLIVGWILGCECLFHFRRWQKDSLLQRFLGGRCPHHSLLYKELDRLGKTNPNVRMELRQVNLEVIRPCLPSKLILDLDSTVETVYGNQAQAAKGVNAHKTGRKSYHPLLAFEGQSRLCLNAVLRAGNVHSSTEAAPFLKETFDLLGQHPVQYARFDKGFGGEDFYSLWKGRQIGYVGKMKWTKRLAAEVAACRYWKRYVDEDWIIEGIALWYQATSWKKPRRVAVIRKAKSFRTTKLVSCWIPIGSMKRSSRAWSGNPSICGAFTTSGVVWKTTSRKPSADLPSIKSPRALLKPMKLTCSSNYWPITCTSDSNKIAANRFIGATRLQGFVWNSSGIYVLVSRFGIFPLLIHPDSYRFFER